jgi:pimeloyl-ACP methyl ester carboxylesterase
MAGAKTLNVLGCAALIAMLGGCSADGPLNPSLPMTFAESRAALREMDMQPRPLERPVLVLCGVFDPGIISGQIKRDLARYTDDQAIFVSVSFFDAFTFDACRDRVIRELEAVARCDDPHSTTEVDVVGFSMGGLVARHAALPRDDGGKRLRIKRLFTIATPHRGASLAWLGQFDPRVKAMMNGSSFLAQLNDALLDADYEIYAYTRLNDNTVGRGNAAPPGISAWWVANPPFQSAHLGSAGDPRILADIARRLRGEPPFSSNPAAPDPHDPVTIPESLRPAVSARSEPASDRPDTSGL